MKKQVLITGAGKGIGKELVKAFMEDGNYRVWAVARNETAINALAEECMHLYGTSPEILLSDITTEEAPIYIYDNVSSFGKLDILINNAGLLENRDFKDVTREELVQILDINLVTPFLLSAKLSGIMATGGHIVNISSMGGVQGSSKFKGLSAYSAAKGGLAVLSECMAVELASLDISVNCLALGAVQTEMLEKAFPGYEAPVNARDMAVYIKEFAEKGNKVFNGKILPVSMGTP